MPEGSKGPDRASADILSFRERAAGEVLKRIDREASNLTNEVLSFRDKLGEDAKNPAVSAEDSRKIILKT